MNKETNIIELSDNKEICPKCGSIEKFELALTNSLECRFICLGCHALISFNRLTNNKKFIKYANMTGKSLGDYTDSITKYLEERFGGEID